MALKNPAVFSHENPRKRVLMRCKHSNLSSRLKLMKNGKAAHATNILVRPLSSLGAGKEPETDMA
ncbi:MAG: hypothetical protein ACYCPM_06645, partial [Acidobacteriaceae bacterium]